MTDPRRQPDLRTRLRELRKSRGWTLTEVAARLDTTPQTISRLETNVMTVSTDWLQRFADLFGVSAAELIEDRHGAPVEVIGSVAANGLVTQRAPAPLPLAIALYDGLAVRADENIGPIRQDSYVVAAKLTGRNVGEAAGHPCICETERGELWLARVIDGIDGKFTLVPLGDGQVQYDTALAWLARVKFDIRFAD